MAMNPMKLMQLKGEWDKFQSRHPKVPMFFKAVGNHAMDEGTVIEMKVTTPDGKEYASNMKVTAEDVQMIQKVKDAAGNM